MTAEVRETEILANVREELQGQGYVVNLRPTSLLIPSFLGSFRPDALAFRSDKNLVVEVASQNPKSGERLKKLSDLVRQQPNWDLHLVWLSAGDRKRSVSPQKPAKLEKATSEIANLIDLGQLRAAFLLCWAALEAAGRMLLTDEMRKPQTPGRLVELLATNGYISQAEADDLRDLARRRNRLIHGDLQTEIKKKAVADMLSILRRLADACARHERERGQSSGAPKHL